MSDDYSIDDIYTGGGENIKGADLKGYDPITLTIAKIEKVDFNDGPKVKLFFKETDKGLILNKTNAKRIASIHGSTKPVDWIGKSVVLAHEIVEYQDKQTDGVRVQMPRTGKQAPLAKKPEPEPEMPSDEIPF